MIKMQIDLPSGLNIDCDKVQKHLIGFIQYILNKARLDKLVIGVSGGVDSALVAFLAVAAIGKDKVTGVILPYKTSAKENIEDAELVIKTLGIARRYVEISPMVDAYFAAHPTTDRNRMGNKMARERMSVLYDISAELGALVIGTSNKSEIMMGYGTLFGDLACALNPLGNMYKTQVRQLAGYVGVPERIITKAPSADLWVGQTDEGELGITYELLDTFLYYYDDKNYSDDKLKELGFTAETIEHVKTTIAKNKFKGQPTTIADMPN